jgi:hypothetical protein
LENARPHETREQGVWGMLGSWLCLRSCLRLHS